MLKPIQKSCRKYEFGEESCTNDRISDESDIAKQQK